MKKIYFFTLQFMLITAIGLHAQAPGIQWERSYGSTKYDTGEYMSQTSDGGYIVTGVISAKDGDVNSAFGNMDCWVAKISPSGTIQWQKTYGGATSEYGTCIKQTSDGGYILLALTWGNSGMVTGSYGNNDIWLVKLDATGAIQWQRMLGGTKYDNSRSIEQTADGGYVIAGTTESNDKDVSGNHGGQDGWVVKLDATGSVQWQKCYGGTDADLIYCIQPTPDGGYVFTGWTKSNDGDVSGNHGQTDTWVVKLDATGTVTWQKVMGGSESEGGTTVRKTSDGGYIIAGFAGSWDGDVVGSHNPNVPIPLNDCWIIKLDAGGNLLWKKAYGGSHDDQGNDIIQTADGGFIVGCLSSSPNNGDVTGGNGQYMWDFWLLKLSAAGAIEWQQCYGGTNHDKCVNIVQGPDGSYTAFGSAISNDGDVKGSKGGSDMWLVKLKSGTGAGTIGLYEQKGKTAISVYPVPSGDEITLSREGTESPYTLVDALGSVVLSGTVSSTDPRISLSTLANGIYYLELGGEKEYRCKVVKN